MSSHNITPFQQMVSSCTGAIMTALFVTPLDVVKVRLQAQQKEFGRNKCFVYCNPVVEDLCCCVNTSNLYRSHPRLASVYLTGTADAFVKISRYEGVQSLWSGLPPTLVMSIPATVVYFTVYDQFRDRLGRMTNDSLWAPVISGASARLVAATTVSPLELIRTKMQSKKLSYLEMGQVVRNLVQIQGISSMWKGLIPTIWRDVPFSCIYWSAYEYMKRRFNQQEPTFCFSLAAGATAGGISAFLTTPFDVLKTHKQIELGESNFMAKNKFSMATQMSQLYRKHGYRSLFTGVVPRLVKITPACAIMISTYEYGKKFFRQRNAAKHKSTSQPI